MVSVLLPSPSRSHASGATVAGRAPTMSSSPDMNVTRGALSGAMGASPFSILATAPELPTSSNFACPATADTSRSPPPHKRPGTSGLFLRRMNSGRNTLGGALPGGPATSVVGSRRLGALLRRVGAVLLILQLLLVGMYIARTGFLRHAAGASSAPTENPSSTEYIIKTMAMESRRSATAGGAFGRLQPQRHQQQPQQSQQQQQAQSQQQQQAKRTASPNLGQAQKSTQPAALTAKPVRLARPVSTVAAFAAAASKFATEVNKDASTATVAAATAPKAATTTAMADKSPQQAAAQPFPPFAKPVVPYSGRLANPPPIVGVVFYGRRDRVRILDCYLQRNMARNGGLLASVVFVSATWQPEDVAFLDRLLKLRQPDYRKIIPERLDKGYTGHYAWMDPATLYVKIDDDVVFIADDAVDHMLAAQMLHRYHLISANVVNHQPLELPHSQSGAHTLYEQAVPGDKSSWKPVMRAAAGAAAGYAATGSAATGSAAAPLQAVPFTDNGWDTWGDWRRAANVHYSFLANHAAGRLGLYEFPHDEQLWDFNKHFGYTRWRINMIMFQGATIDVHVYNMSSTTGTYPGDDEDFITRILPQQLNRTSAAVSRALAVHFSFFKQREGLENSTDLLGRYALLAEQTCGRLVSAA